MEEHLCTAPCHNALNSVHHILCLKMWMVEYKNKNMRGQQDGIRLQAGINAIHEWALVAAHKYCTAREVKLKLSSSGDWERTLHKLKDSNIRSYQDPDHFCRGTGCQETNEDSWGPGSTSEPVEHDIDLYQDDHEKWDGTGQTWHTLSWIWMTMKINLDNGADEISNEVLHSKWCCSHARAHWACEKILLLWEEMHRTLRFLKWWGEWWMKQCSIWNVGATLLEALAAYALKQSDL